jgi:hypothetical protein
MSFLIYYVQVIYNSTNKENTVMSNDRDNELTSAKKLIASNPEFAELLAGFAAAATKNPKLAGQVDAQGAQDALENAIQEGAQLNAADAAAAEAERAAAKRAALIREKSAAVTQAFATSLLVSAAERGTDIPIDVAIAVASAVTQRSSVNEDEPSRGGQDVKEAARLRR